MQEQQILKQLDELTNERTTILETPTSTENWGTFKIKGRQKFRYSPNPLKIFEKGLPGVKAASLPMAQKYGMDSQSELGQIISDLNQYFKAERKRIGKDYDKILYQLSAELQQNQQYIPSEFDKQVSQLLSGFPAQQKDAEPVQFVPYAKQIPAYKFEMVEYLCIASIVYGLQEYALDAEQKLSEERPYEYKKGIPVLNETATEFQSLLTPALQQLKATEGKPTQEDDPATEMSTLCNEQLPEWNYSYRIAEATKADGYFGNGIESVALKETPYDKLVALANMMYTWRAGWCGQVYGKYVMYPVLVLADNALAADVQTKADKIRKYRMIADYVQHRANFAKQLASPRELQK